MGWSRLVSWIIRRTLRQTFRRICWVGEWPSLPTQTPTILYANHHSYYDGYLAWYLARYGLERPAMTWMEDWDRFPFFAAEGAQPFPPDDPARRATTLRRTVQRFRTVPETVLIYFPEGHLHPPDEGIVPFSSRPLARLDRLFPEKRWWPVALHVTWWGESLPTALLTGGTPHATITGDEHARLEDLWHTLRAAPPTSTTLLLDGHPSPHETWNLSLLHRLFERHL